MPSRSPELRTQASFFIDGVCLSESGHNLIKSLSVEHPGTRKKRKKLQPVEHDKEAGIMATIESVVAGGSAGETGFEDTKIEMVDLKEEPQEIYKEGMIWTKEDGPPPEGFTIFTMESGVSVLRRKRQRNLQKLGIGGFLVRMRGFKTGQENDEIDTLSGQSTSTGSDMLMQVSGGDADKPKKKPIRRKIKSKLTETFPPYLQEAFFGKDLMDITEFKREVENYSSDEEKLNEKTNAIKLTAEELIAVESAKQKRHPLDQLQVRKNVLEVAKVEKTSIKEEEDDANEDLKDVLALPGDLLDTDLVNSIINEDDELTKNTELDALADDGELGQTLGSSENSKDAKDELSDILGSHFSLESIPNINGNDVEDIFKGVLTDESQESQLSQETSVYQPIQQQQQQQQQPQQPQTMFQNNSPQMPSTSGGIPQIHPLNQVSRPANSIPNVQHVSFPPSPYHSEYSNSPQFSPAFSEPPSPWVNINDSVDMEAGGNVGVPPTQRSSEKMRADESLGNGATISAVLYANMNHPEWKTEYPIWSDRYKQIIKKWRTLSSDQKAPFLQQARDNRSQLRMKKQQQDQEKMVQQQKSAREAEQERQWKQLQALRQHQAQQQQHVIHEQRVQAIARVQRTVSDPTGQFLPGSHQTSPLQVVTPPQEVSTSAGSSPRQFIGIKSPPFAHPSPPSSSNSIRTPTSASQSPVNDIVQTQVQNSDGDSQNSVCFSKANQGNEQQYASIPRVQQFVTNRPTIQGRPDQPEITRQLRDLLQRQQQQMMQNKTQTVPRVWSNNDSNSETTTSSVAPGEDITFRQPLPPGAARPRGPLQIGNIRPGANIRMPQMEGRLQGLDPRLRVILQNQPRMQVPGQQHQQLRFSTASGVRQTTIEQYEQLLQRQQQQQLQVRTISAQIPMAQVDNNIVHKPAQQQQLVVENNQSMNNEQEIPDNVTAELEKLEQETGTMAELQGVSEILGGLGDDDDELLAEMGADFNILEYADPELENLAGEKTNILFLDLVDDHVKHDKKKEIVQKQQIQQGPPVQTSTVTAPGSLFQASKNVQEVPKHIDVASKMDNPVLTQPSISHQQQPQQIHNDNMTTLTTTITETSPSATQSAMQTAPSPLSNQPQLPDQQQQQQQSIPPSPVNIPSNSSAITSPAPTPPPPSPHPSTNFAVTPQQIQQQMLHQVGCKMSKYVQQAAALGKPMPPGSKLQTPDGIVGIVLANNNVQLQIPPNFHQRILQQINNPNLKMRVGRALPRPTGPQSNVVVNQAGVPPSPNAAPGQIVRPRMPITAPQQPPPPPYPGPPPPYPGNVISSQSQEQPLLLEDLLEQEKREQEKQHQGHPPGNDLITSRSSEPESALLSDHDFERLKADVLNSSHVPETNPGGMVQQQQQQQHWPQNNRVPVAPSSSLAQPTTEITTRVQMFNANLVPAPPLPPESIVNEQDRQTQIVYEQWLNHQNNVLSQQLRYYETEVQKLRKSRKSLNSKQRQLKKSGNHLNEVDSNELQRISAEQAILQKHLESSRKQSRQHGMLIQEYRNKQQPQVKQQAQMPSPLGPPGSSPIHHPATSHSPMLSPQQPSPMAQHNSPMNSPGHGIAHSPSHGNVAALLQSPGGNNSPRTPLPQEGSPGPAQSPSQVCLPPPAPRMTSPQHRRLVTSPVGYSADIRNTVTQMRFMRPNVDHNALQRLRTQTPSPLQGFPQKPGTPSPLNSPPLNQMTLAQQQILQKQIHQQQVLLDNQDLHGQRVNQLIQHRNMNRPIVNQQQAQSVIQQHLTKQQQQQQLALQLQARLNQQPQSPMTPKSPLHQQQNMSPHSMPSSPMPPKSPMVSFSNQQQPGSPAARNSSYQQQNSPMMHQYQTPNSPMTMIQSPHALRRPPSASSSPAMPERPTSVENPGTPRTPSSYSMDGHYQDSGGGNPCNPTNPIPLPPQGFEYRKLGLRGGAPMWSGFGRGEKRVPTPPSSDSDKQQANESALKPKKEAHINKVSILKKKTAAPKSSPKLIVSQEIEEASTSPAKQKTMQLPEMVDFEDDNSTILSSEVSLSAAAQQNDDEMEIAETLSQNDLGEVLASPMEVEQNSDDFLLFQGNMMVDIAGNVPEETEEEYANIVIRSPTTSDDEFIMQGRTKKYNILNITETETSRSPDEEVEDDENSQLESEVVIIDHGVKTPEEQISTKEDFEELIDEGSRKEKLKLDNKIAQEKFIATSVYSFPPKAPVTVTARPNIVTKMPQKISLITTTPIIQNFTARNEGCASKEPQQLILTPTTKINTSSSGSKLTSIILTHNSVRSNILSVNPKLMQSSQGITIVNATTSQIASILPSKITVPLISASAVRQLPNVKVIDKPSSSLSLTTAHDTSLPKKIFEDDSVSPDTFDEDKKNVFEEKIKTELSSTSTKLPLFSKSGFSKMDGVVLAQPRQKITIIGEKRKNESDNSEVKEKVQVLAGPIITKSSSPVVIHQPELKMTAQLMQDSNTHMQITATETRSFDGSSEDKSIVISIPSPTPSQEQMLDNIALQALKENRRREFESFEDVLDMIENMQNLDNPESAAGDDEVQKQNKQSTEVPQSKPQNIPQLSPLSQPSDLTTNMANASQQLRTLLSTLQTTSNVVYTSNVETLVVKSGAQKMINVTSVAAPVVASRIVEQNVSTVIVPNVVKQKTVSSNFNATQKNIMMLDSGGSDVKNESKTQIEGKTSEVTKKASLTLTAMLQNQPAATPTTKSSPDSITAASLLATPVSLSRTSFSPSLAQAQPNAIIATISTNSNASTSSNSVITTPFRTNLLHTQLTKSRTKSLDDIKDLKSEEQKIDTENDGGCKYSSMASQGKAEDSNVLLKKLLQNTACASTQSLPPNSSCMTTVSAPSVEVSKPSPPTLSSLLPPVSKPAQEIVSTSAQTTRPVVQRSLIRETSFVSSPIVHQQQSIVSTSTGTATNQQLHIDVSKKCAPPSRSSSRDDLLSPPTPRSTCSQDSSLQTPPLKKESGEIKKELLDETSQNSVISDQSKSDVQVKEESDLGVDPEKLLLDKEELKKQKRRMYNQKRRQNLLMNKEMNSKPNKRPRKNSKLEEDYDSYIDSVLSQIRHLPPMVVQEPVLSRNYGVMPIFGSGDLSKIGTKAFDPRFGELTGSYGDAQLPGFSDFYSTKPYGDEDPLPEIPPASTTRGFYDQEFPLIRFDSNDHKKFDLFSRDDTPDSVISCSSSECDPLETTDRYVGLKLISDDEDEELPQPIRKSPDIPIIKPIAIRLKPSGLFLKDSTNISEDKENVINEVDQETKKHASSGKDKSENIKVTLTLTSSAAEDIVGVLRDLANILQIPPPTTYQIVDRTSSPSDQKLGIYRTKGKDGKEGAPIDIQSILNGAAKFCKHCDVVILNNLIRKKLSDLPFLAKDFELLSEGEELYFCSSACYMQFALMHRSPSISEDKAAAIIDHLSQKVKTPPKQGDEKINDPMKLEGLNARIANFASTPYYSNLKSANRFGTTKPGQDIAKNANYKKIHKYWTPGCLQPSQKHKKMTDKEIMEMLYQMKITVTPPKMPEDTRKCVFCHMIGDGVADGPARLLNFDVDKWVHLNCALWSHTVYETVSGALMNLSNAMQQSLTTICVHCQKLGATIRCLKPRCSNVYHLPCAVRDNCVFFKDKTISCTAHVPKNEKDNELTTLLVGRRVYVNRDENRQVAAVMHHSDTNNLLRVGSLIFLNVGQLLPHQLQTFHSPNYIYPIGYKIIRFYWSMRHLNKRCRYICTIHDSGGRPEFRVLVQEYNEEDVEFKDFSCKAVWSQILEKIADLRKENQCLQMFPKYIIGEDLFGLTEPAIVRVLESLPGIETLSDYKFKYGRNPLLELPLAINPSGAARTEPRLRHQTHWKRPHTQRTTGSSSRPLFGPSSSLGSTNPSSFGESVCPYSKQFVHSKSSQYKKMKQEWRNNVYLARSKIQGLGLYAARDLEKHTMVIEYIGEVIRTELSECREKQYEAKNRGIYMFRLDDDRVVDATLSGGLARYINHSCNPNCVAETVEIDRDLKIIIFAKRRIQRGEELAYDYKFDIEDDQNKISCMCGAPNCRKWMN
ncbi:hypothetical protein ABEB36_013038 [Hypothenemus hampei]|uniref:Histone-lysine N-methyltransferase 2C n=1 Tax=Hypothenemus hampei TaxID=57062 RepID=A0ABD1E6N0_HYPHA